MSGPYFLWRGANMKKVLGIIGGSGLYNIDGIENEEWGTRYGAKVLERKYVRVLS